MTDLPNRRDLTDEEKRAVLARILRKKLEAQQAAAPAASALGKEQDWNAEAALDPSIRWEERRPTWPHPRVGFS